MTRFFLHASCFGAILFFAGLIPAQETAQPQPPTNDFARSEQLLPPVLRSKVKNAFVVPHWIGQQDEFWYRRDTAKGHEFVIVEAASGHMQPAFDHEEMAKAFSKASGAEVTAESLPFEDILFNADRSSIHVTANDKTYDCQIKPATCGSGKPVFPPTPVTITFLKPKAPPGKIDRDEGVLVSPDKKWGVFTRNDNLWQRNFKTRKDTPLTRDGVKHFGYGDYLDELDEVGIPRERALKAGRRLLPMGSFWSPDSRFVIVPRGDDRFVGDYPYVENVPQDGSFRPQLHIVKLALVGEKPPTLDWFIFNIPAKTHRRINFPCEKLLEVDPDGLPIRKKWWSADHRHLYALTVGRHMGSGLLFDVDLLSGNTRTMVEEHMTPRMDMSPNPWDAPDVWVSPDGKDVLWFSERDGWGHLYLYDGQTGKLRNQVTRGEWLVRDIIQVDDQLQRIYFTASGREKGNPYYRYLYRINFDGSDLTLLSPEPADHMLTSKEDRLLPFDRVEGYDVISPSGKFAVYNFSTPDQPPQAVIRSTGDGELISTFEKADATELLAVHYRPPEEFVAKAADGTTDLWSLVYKPSNFDPSKRYPVIDLEYATPVTAVVPRNFIHATVGVPAGVSAPMTAERGFIVLAIDARGTPFRSREFSQAGFGQLNIIGLDDHVAVIRQLAERFNYVDINRVGICGASFGGWSALWGMLDFPDFFKVGVSIVPIANMQSASPGEELDAYQGVPVYSNGTDLRSRPGEVPENWKVIDMRQKAANLKGHLLVVMGELDENANPPSAFIFLHTLMEADKDFDFVYLVGSTHAPASPKVAAYTRRRTEDYLVRYLIGEPPQR